MKAYSWAMVCREAEGEKIIEYAHQKRVTEDFAKSHGIKVVQYFDQWITADYARKLKKEAFKLMDLPSELRREVLEKLVPDTYLAVFLRGKYGSPTGISLPPIARASKTLRSEFLIASIESITFSIHSGAGNEEFQKWLGSIDLSRASKNYTTGFDAVKSLDFPFASRFPHASKEAHDLNNDIELMRKCRNLETVGMTWHGQELIGVINGNYQAKPVTTLRTQYRLDRMLSLKNLKILRLSGIRMWPESSTALQQLADWLEFQFKMQKQDGYRSEEVQVVIC